jgi:predicted dehydrogenase
MNEQILGAQQEDETNPGSGRLHQIPVPPEKAGGWHVEADFVESIRDGKPVRFTDFAAGLAYMEFTEAVARSAVEGRAVELPV